MHSFASVFPVNIFQCVAHTEMGLFGVGKRVPEWPRATRGALEKDETETKRVDWDRIEARPSAFRRYGIDKRRGQVWGGGVPGKPLLLEGEE